MVSGDDGVSLYLIVAVLPVNPDGLLEYIRRVADRTRKTGSSKTQIAIPSVGVRITQQLALLASEGAEPNTEPVSAFDKPEPGVLPGEPPEPVCAWAFSRAKTVVNNSPAIVGATFRNMSDLSKVNDRSFEAITIDSKCNKPHGGNSIERKQAIGAELPKAMITNWGHSIFSGCSYTPIWALIGDTAFSRVVRAHPFGW